MTEHDAWTPILICEYCGTPQYPAPDADGFHCLACGRTAHHSLPLGTWEHVYTMLRLRQDGPLTGAMLLERRRREGTPLPYTLAIALTESVSRFRIIRARTLLVNTYNSLKRFRLSNDEQHEGNTSTL